MSSRCVALLGQPDSPTDAVEDYCNYLALALPKKGIQLEIARVAWKEKGWRQALAELGTNIRKEPPQWFFLHYTALAWSRRGFPWRVLRVLRLLKRTGARVATVFHDVEPYRGSRTIDRLRRVIQLKTMRRAVHLCDASIFTVPVEKIRWLGNGRETAVFIPVGANLPAPERAWIRDPLKLGTPPTVAMFALSSGGLAEEEARFTADILSQVTQSLGHARLAVMGRNSGTAGQILREKLSGMPVELVVHGMLSGEELVTVLSSCDALVFLRGAISSRRGSAIAGIACGLPVIAEGGWETAAPIADAGVVLVHPRTPSEFGHALLRVLQDPAHRAQLANRSRIAQREHFSWDAIAARYVKLLESSDA